MSETVTLKELRGKISTIPRVRIATHPTQLHEVPRFSKALGGPWIFIKRDDLTGFAFGGNKTRMFEFLLAKAKQLVAACNTRDWRHISPCFQCW
jgi:D-cysteine desulfhydrase/L-cysteate sulfo-lyase